MFTGFNPSNMQGRYWLQRNTIRIEFRGPATRQLVRSTLVGKEIPERTGNLERVASPGAITFLCRQCSLRGLSPRLRQSPPAESLRSGGRLRTARGLLAGRPRRRSVHAGVCGWSGSRSRTSRGEQGRDGPDARWRPVRWFLQQRQQTSAAAMFCLARYAMGRARPCGRGEAALAAWET